MSPQQSIAHYRITAKLGEGGMGEVWRATDTKLSREVAIKILPEAFAADPDRMARFTREARAAAMIQHPNICPVFDVGEADGIHYLSMAFIEGEPLSAHVKDYASRPPRSPRGSRIGDLLPDRQRLHDRNRHRLRRRHPLEMISRLGQWARECPHAIASDY